MDFLRSRHNWAIKTIKEYGINIKKYIKRGLLKDKGTPHCIYIDCDLYSSTMTVLQFVEKIAVTGTWILFDDYWCFRGSPKFGEQRAINEWLQSNKRIGLSDYCNFRVYGKAFIAYEK